MSDIKNKIPENIYSVLEQHLNNIKYGSITLVIQDGKVVQIESNEKIRVTHKNTN